MYIFEHLFRFFARNFEKILLFTIIVHAFIKKKREKRNVRAVLSVIVRNENATEYVKANFMLGT